MKSELKYTLETDNGDRDIKIHTYSSATTGNGAYATGVFALHEGETNLGDIVFDDKMKQWEYTGMGNLNHKEAERIAEFIQSSKNDK
ncbi:hypothetical protein GCM10027049_13660 [Mucilaginibacter puniceus]